MKPRINLGTDIITINRFKKKVYEKNKKFYASIFSKSEISYCNKYTNPYPHFAGIFAAKEAVVKCLDEPLSISDVKLKWDKNGKPIARIEPKKLVIKISISHNEDYAIAVAVYVA